MSSILKIVTQRNSASGKKSRSLALGLLVSVAALASGALIQVPFATSALAGKNNKSKTDHNHGINPEDLKKHHTHKNPGDARYAHNHPDGPEKYNRKKKDMSRNKNASAVLQHIIQLEPRIEEKEELVYNNVIEQLKLEAQQEVHKQREEGSHHLSEQLDEIYKRIEELGKVDSTNPEISDLQLIVEALNTQFIQESEDRIKEKLSEKMIQYNIQLLRSGNPDGNLPELLKGLNNDEESLSSLSSEHNSDIQQNLAISFFDTAETVLQHDPIESLSNSPIKVSRAFKNLVAATAEVKATLAGMFTPSSSHDKLDKIFSALPSNRELPKYIRTMIGKAAFWLRTNVQASNQKPFENPETRFSELNSNTVSSHIGLDYQVNNKLRAGITTGYSKTAYRLGEGKGRGDIDSYQLGTYGNLQVTPAWYVDGFLSYSYNNIKGERDINILGEKIKAEQKHNSHQVGAVVETGYDIAIPQDFKLTPFANTGIVYLRERGYTEKGAGKLGLNVKGHGRKYFQGKTGAQLSKHFIQGETQVHGYISLAYTYRKGLGNAAETSASFVDLTDSFTVSSRSKPDNMFSPGLGLTALFKNNVFVSLGYNGDFGKNVRAHNGFIKIGKKL